MESHLFASRGTHKSADARVAEATKDANFFEKHGQKVEVVPATVIAYKESHA